MCGPDVSGVFGHISDSRLFANEGGHVGSDIGDGCYAELRLEHFEDVGREESREADLCECL